MHACTHDRNNDYNKGAMKVRLKQIDSGVKYLVQNRANLRASHQAAVMLYGQN